MAFHATHWSIPAQDFTPLEFEEIVDLFKEFDKDKSGYIDEEELCEMMRALEMDHSLAKAKEMMLEIVLTRRLFLNFKLASMASTRRHATATPSTRPREAIVAVQPFTRPRAGVTHGHAARVVDAFRAMHQDELREAAPEAR